MDMGHQKVFHEIELVMIHDAGASPSSMIGVMLCVEHLVSIVTIKTD